MAPGSHDVMYLPRLMLEAAGKTGPIGPSEDHPCIVMLVDDQAIVAEAVRSMLAAAPELTLHYCSNPAEAVAIARLINPTIILQDLVMPDVDGLTLLRQYRADPMTKDVPVIVLSTKEEASVKSEAFSAGASDYLVKLPDRLELIARLRLHSKARVNQLQRDEAYRGLCESQRQLTASNAELVTLNAKLEEATLALRVQAMHDSLTGLLNRTAFFDLFQREIARALRHPGSLALIMADVDHFKDINDRHGHLSGDAVLREISRRLRASLRPSDVIGRYGGEEFVVAAPDCNLADAAVLAERLRSSIGAPAIDIPGERLSVTISCGVAATVDIKNAGGLLRSADEALYRAKRGGRNRVERSLP